MDATAIIATRSPAAVEDKCLYQVPKLERIYPSFYAAVIAWITCKQLGYNMDPIASGICRALNVSDK